MNIRNSNEWLSVPIDSIKPYGRHVRRHDRRKITKLKKLIGHFGQVAPIIIDDNRVIIDGHAVWQAMRELGSGDIAAFQLPAAAILRSRRSAWRSIALPQEAHGTIRSYVLNSKT